MAPILCDRCSDIIVSQANEEETINAIGWDLLDELAQLDALLERLTIKRCDLKRKINQLRSPIVRQLPPDVMSNIFEFCLPDSGFADFKSSAFPSGLDICAPLALGAICEYWREIAWSTPRLWSSLIVHVTSSKYDSHTAILAQEWLARSGQLPLSIRIFSSPHIFVFQLMRQAVSALADIINQYSTRWSDFDLCLPQSVYKYFHATDNHAPILKSIRLRHSDGGVGGHDSGNLQLTCPRLQTASLSLLWTARINIQWDNLTHLYLNNIPDCLFILRNTPRLVFCAFSCMDGSAMSTEVPVLTPLRSLQLETINYCTDQFLNSLISPHLEELSLSADYYTIHRNDAPEEPIISLINRSTCSLRSFSIINTFVSDPEDLTTLLQSMPSLRKLSIMATDFFGPWNILQVVASILSSQSIIPPQGFLSNLEILKYTGKLPWLGPGNDVDLYLWPSVDHAIKGPLQSVELDLFPANRIPQNIIPFFLRLMEQDITVNVWSKSQDILQSSISYYKCREESRSRDWVDDLDLSLIQDLP